MGEEDALGAKARDQAAQGRVNGITFDAGGLIALERNDRRVFSILNTALGTAIASSFRPLPSRRSSGTRPSRYAFGV